ncbi:kelch repeat-containing protein [Chengkuizengella sp. SCS-71B]|uniref:Kelch repeat-containing protein n=1 Tax=Chengkuizengella sp. SCS-71B TaxID=3115290 RepID=UPI0032C23CB8
MKKSFKVLFSIVLTMVMLLSAVPVFAVEEGVWTEVASMNVGVYALQTEVVNGKIYAIGGAGEVLYTNKVEEYNPITNTWVEVASMNYKRRYFQTEALNGKIFAIGGDPNGTSAEVYDPATDTWTSLPPLKYSRRYFQTEVVNGKIYVIGNSEIMEVYDPITNTWDEVASPMNYLRVNVQTEVINGKIYAMGGYNGEFLNSVEVYDLISNTWTQLPSMNDARNYFQTVLLNGEIYAIGSSGNASNTLNTVEKYNPITNIWAEVASMNNYRGEFEAKVIDGKIYVFGGSDQRFSPTQYLDSVEVYDPTSDTWTELSNMNYSKGRFQTELYNGNIYTIGGYSVSGTLINNVEVLNLYLPQIPNTPSNLTGEAGDSQVNLLWDLVEGADSYTIKRSTTQGGPYDIIAEGITGTTYSDLDVENGITYYYMLSAVNAAGESENSNEASATPEATVVEIKNRAILVIVMENGLEKEYDITMNEVEDFINWYQSNLSVAYAIEKTSNMGPFLNRKDYIIHDNILTFEVNQYEVTQ